jgi:hypothetical protein
MCPVDKRPGTSGRAPNYGLRQTLGKSASRCARIPAGTLQIGQNKHRESFQLCFSG